MRIRDIKYEGKQVQAPVLTGKRLQRVSGQCPPKTYKLRCTACGTQYTGVCPKCF